MRIILRRRIGVTSGNRPAEYRQLALKVRTLTIGRAADRHIHIEHPDVARRHARLYEERGTLFVRSVGAGTVTVNDTVCRRSRLVAGDVMTIGATRITVEQLRPDGVVVLRHNDPQILSTAVMDTPEARSLKGAGLNARAWSWYLALTLLALGLVAPLASALVGAIRPVAREVEVLPSDVSWQPGALHVAHGAIRNDCNACHTTPFKRVDSAACESCHQAVHQHVASLALQRALFAGGQCADCHPEHHAQTSLIDHHPASCTVCHADLKARAPDTALQDVASFSSHPDFVLTVQLPGDRSAPGVAVGAEKRDDARQQTNLTFSHKVHLDAAGIDSPTGRRRLDCEDCHTTDTSGRNMQPVRMERHCIQCHALRFDEHDPASKVPHGDLPALFSSLREHFSRTYLDQRLGQLAGSERRRPGDEAAALSQAEQRRALAWTDLQTSRAARELLEKRVCVECHRVERMPPGLPDAESWRVQPVRMTEHWYPRATFSHAKHKTESCKSCHAQIELADDSEAVHMPGIATCHECHGDNGSAKVSSNCLTCHEFHRPGNGLFTAGTPPPAHQGAP